VNTLSVQNGTTPTPYTAFPGQTITVPVQMNTTLDGNASIYSIQFTLRYQRDMFIANPVVADNGLTIKSSDTTTDPTDPRYILNTVTVHSNSPITSADGTIAHVQLEYVLSKDSVSDLDVMNPVYFDQSGNTACWVSHDTVPSAFAGLDRCGDFTIHRLLQGGTVSFKVQQITPNPVSGDANVGLSILLDGVPLRIDVYNILGQGELNVLDAQAVPAGNHTQTFSTSLLPAGQYVLRVTDGTTVQSVPFVVQK
ncbi:MAG: T9SS type A sorting domain-containing protein, partial [Candidatus Kapaibacterium sp.]